MLSGFPGIRYAGGAINPMRGRYPLLYILNYKELAFCGLCMQKDIGTLSIKLYRTGKFYERLILLSNW
jgi:hypothetical protein